jgi:signal transduction histidine kinase
MNFPRSLRYRVALAFALFGGLISLALGAGMYFASHDLGERLIDETLTAELEDYIARRARNPQSLPESTATIRGFVLGGNEAIADVPGPVRALLPGRHQLELDGRSYRAAVADRHGERYVILYNEERLKRRERAFIAFLAGGIVVASLVSAALGLWLAGRVISPVTDLARRMRGLRPEDHPPPLARDFAPDEVGELARDFDQYLNRLRDFIERERAFTSDVSHELRTPLAVINGAAEVLLSESDADPRTRERLLRISRAASEMAELTEALLLLAREEAAGAPVSVSCSVGEVVHDVVDKLKALYRAKPLSVEFELATEVTLPVDRALLAIVVGNLIRNAFSYTDQGSIVIRVDDRGVTVQDTGAGMDQAELKHIFERFYRGAGSDGAGIGLSLVKRICDRYGWRIDLSSTPGQGTLSRLRFSTS